VAVQVTLVFVVPETVAVNCCVVPPFIVTNVGEIATAMIVVGAMVMAYVFEYVCFPHPMTVTVKAYCAAVVGVSPRFSALVVLDGCAITPAGVPVHVHMYGVQPFAALTVAEYGTPTVPFGRLVVVIVTLASATCARASETVRMAIRRRGDIPTCSPLNPLENR
jgi:hypothetical protein